jgi:hypothetical protein
MYGKIKSNAFENKKLKSVVQFDSVFSLEMVKLFLSVSPFHSLFEIEENMVELRLIFCLVELGTSEELIFSSLKKLKLGFTNIGNCIFSNSDLFYSNDRLAPFEFSECTSIATNREKYNVIFYRI